MDWLETLGGDLAQEYGAVAVLLYGSHARGAARQESDVDVMILVPLATRSCGLPVTPAPCGPPKGARAASVATGADPSHAAARRAYEKVGFDRSIPSVWYCRML